MHFLARALSKSISSSLNSTARQSWFLSQHFLSTSSPKTSRTRGGGIAANSESVTPEKSVEWSRPTEIPYQPKIANSVDLIGYVHQPVQFNALDGNFWAGTVISHGPSSDSESESDSASARKFWIPVIFEGDLAHTANCHLKKNDRVHITGHVLVDAFPSGANPGRECVQVMVHDLHYVEGSKAAPKVLPTTDKNDVIKHSASLLKGRGIGTDGWFDLLDKPGEWCDYRESKQNQSVNPRHPDFKKKDGSIALWLEGAPKEIFSDLKDMKFDTPVKSKYPKQQKAGEESWKDLVANMNKWWDNRLDKRNVKAPDFKHKETGVGLWLSDSPSWVIEKLPEPKSNTRDGY